MGVFAVERIDKGEIIAGWKKGTIYWARRASELPYRLKDHAVQFAENLWIDHSEGIARFSNHSCEPNCGIQDFQIVAMREIQPDEEITWDYDMTENSDWQMACRCGTPSCRGLIHGHRFLPDATRQKYVDYIAQYLSRPPYPDHLDLDLDKSDKERMSATALGTSSPGPGKVPHSRSLDRRFSDRRIAPRGTLLPRGVSTDRRANSDRRVNPDRRAIPDRRIEASTKPIAFPAS